MAETGETKDVRVATIRSVKTPIGLISLITVVIEGILAGLAFKATGRDFTLLVWAFCIYFACLLVLVFMAIFRRPELLGATSSGPLTTREIDRIERELSRRDPHVKLETAVRRIEPLEERVRVLEMERAAFESRVSADETLKDRLWVHFNNSSSVNISGVMEGLRISGDTPPRSAVDAIVGVWLKEGKLVPDGTNSGYFRVVRKS